MKSEEQEDEEEEKDHEISAALENHFVDSSIDHFLRTLDLQTLRAAENKFLATDTLDLPTFVGLLGSLIKAPSEVPVDHRDDIVRLAAVRLFEDLEVFQKGSVKWMKFIEYIICRSESLRKQRTNFCKDFYTSTNLLFHWKPASVKAHYTKAYYWAPIDAMMIFACGAETSIGDRGIIIHHPASFQRRRSPIAGHTRDLLSAEYLPAPLNMVVTSGNDQVVNFLDGESFANIRRWNGVSVGQLCWANEMNVLYASDHFGEKIHAWPIAGSLELRRMEMPKSKKHLEFPGHSQPVQCMKWIGHMHTLVSCALDSTIRLWDAIGPDRSPKMELVGHKKGITCLDYSMSTRLLCSAGYESHILLWDPNAGARIGALEGHSVNIMALTSIPNSYELVSLDAEGISRRWDLRHLKCLQTLNTNEESPDGDFLEPRAMASMGHRIIVTGRSIVAFDRDVPDLSLTTEVPVTQMLYSPRQKEIILPHPPSSLRIWNVFRGTIKSIVPLDCKGSVTALALDRHDQRVLVGTENGEMVVLNAGCLAQTLKTLTAHVGEVTQMACVPDKIVTCANDKAIVVHDDTHARTSCVLKKIVPPSYLGPMARISIHEERFLVGCASSDGHVFWYNTAPVKLEGARKEIMPPVHESACVCAEFIFSVPLMVTGDVDGRLVFHSLKPFVPYEVFHRIKASPEQSGLTCMMLSPDERSLACSLEGTLVCCDVSSIIDAAAELVHEIAAGGKRNSLTEAEREALPKVLPDIWTAQAHKGSIDSLQILGKVLLSLGIDCSVRMWDWETGECLGALSANPGVWQLPALPRCVPPPHPPVEPILESRQSGTVQTKAKQALLIAKPKSGPSHRWHSRRSVADATKLEYGSTQKAMPEREVHLPPLDSGLKRRPRFDTACKMSADRLANALAAVGDHRLAREFDQF
eukprot:GEMP01009342.1.p1 GENE.GEMP01009342.1~~GEMP01009342.1.p1  ORF type:complete len:940 (+),score=228.10 GEMP01009342.1:55-2820(+)